MKTTVLAISLFTTTAAAVALYPAADRLISTPPDTSRIVPRIDPLIKPVVAEQPRKIEVVFVLDTTGSMGGLIQAAKDKIWSIASSMAQAQPTPELKIGLVAYRDRGDAYVTRVEDLSSDIDTLYGSLLDYRAEGGGDTPESVNQALADAVNQISWSDDPTTYKVVFLVGDAPPHLDYQDEMPYPQTLALAREKGIVVNTIQCGQQPETVQSWTQIAALGGGQYFDVAQEGSAVAIATPFDERLANLAAELDGTRLYYGDRKAKVKQQAKQAATDKLHTEASSASQARRAAFNASDAGSENFLGEGELVEAVRTGKVDLDTVDEALLPEPVRAMAPAARAELVKEHGEKRERLQAQVRQLADERDAYVEQELKATGGAEDSLDDKIYRAVREQAADVGLRYDATAPSY